MEEKEEISPFEKTGLLDVSVISAGPSEQAQGDAFVAKEENAGHLISLNDFEIDKLNFKVLAAANEGNVTFFIPAEQPFELLFFRRIFTRLREQLAAQMRETGQVVDISDDVDDTIPVAAFQRVMGRLFYVLRDPEGFDAAAYDVNHNSCVGWGEFTQVWKDRQITLRLSMAERIFMTFDDPQSCTMAKIVSIGTLAAIVVSSMGFILSTVPAWQEVPADGSAPKPGPAFKLLENLCLIVFVIEYFTRLFTCPTARTEVCDKEVLLEMASGYERIQLSSPRERIFSFVFAPSNMIDLVAILPGVIDLFYHDGGGGFVVLRLVRLTRIFRAFRIGKYVESVVIIHRTLVQSQKALYVLGFNLLLGVVIFGSLMYLLEQGIWDPAIQAYKRKVDRHWDDSLQDYVADYAPSPWHSIPYSFWWALVTSAGVGYGDKSNIPSTANGKIVATICMVWSLVILALPVGVVGGTFNRVWHQYTANKETEGAAIRREMVYVASAVQRMQPHKVSCLVMLEVWGDDGSDNACMPMDPDGFMGMAKLALELVQDQPVSRELKIRLQSDAATCNREVTGFISVRYDWMPDPNGPPQKSQSSKGPATSKLHLHGTLRFTLIGASGLLNTDWSRPGEKSSPFVVMLCYPHSPAVDTDDARVQPVVWRSHVACSSLNPRWDCGRTFNYLWYIDVEEKDPSQDGSPSFRKTSPRRPLMANPGNLANSLSILTQDLPKVTTGIEKLSDELQRLTLRVDQLQRDAAKHGTEDPVEKIPSVRDAAEKVLQQDHDDCGVTVTSISWEDHGDRCYSAYSVRSIS